MKKVILTESDKKQILSEREQAIIDNFDKTFGKIKRVDENQLNELSPELKYRAFQQASDDFDKYGNQQGGEHDELKSRRRGFQADAFQEVNPAYQREANDIAKFILPGGEGKVGKNFYNGEPMVHLTFKNEEDGQFCGYAITKNEIRRMQHSNFLPPDNMARRIERLARKMQQTELPDLNDGGI